MAEEYQLQQQDFSGKISEQAKVELLKQNKACKKCQLEQESQDYMV